MGIQIRSLYKSIAHAWRMKKTFFQMTYQLITVILLIVTPFVMVFKPEYAIYCIVNIVLFPIVNHAFENLLEALGVLLFGWVIFGITF